jgi:hypothetical protein
MDGKIQLITFYTENHVIFKITLHDRRSTLWNDAWTANSISASKRHAFVSSCLYREEKEMLQSIGVPTAKNVTK